MGQHLQSFSHSQRVILDLESIFSTLEKKADL